MDQDDFRANLERALEASVTLSEKAQREQVEKLAAERLQKLVEATAHLERAKASTRFGWALFFMGGIVVIIAIYMRVDERQPDSLFALILSLVLLMLGGTLLHRSTVAQRARAEMLERIHAGSE